MAKRTLIKKERFVTKKVVPKTEKELQWEILEPILRDPAVAVTDKRLMKAAFVKEYGK